MTDIIESSPSSSNKLDPFPSSSNKLEPSQSPANKLEQSTPSTNKLEPSPSSNVAQRKVGTDQARRRRRSCECFTCNPEYIYFSLADLVSRKIFWHFLIGKKGYLPDQATDASSLSNENVSSPRIRRRCVAIESILEDLKNSK